MKRTWAVRSCASASFWPSALGLKMAMLAVFAQHCASDRETYVDFHTVSGLENGNFVRIAGVRSGQGQDHQDPRRRYSAGRVRRRRLGGVDRGQPGGHPLPQPHRRALPRARGRRRRNPSAPPPATIPLARTAPALDLDALLGGFRPLFPALNPDQVNALSEQLVAALQGEAQPSRTSWPRPPP